MKRVAYAIYKTPEYQEWFESQPLKAQVQIEDRLSKIEVEGYFGEHKFLSDGIWELKWKNGRRVYYAYIPEQNILLLFGGNKNGQSKDITQAKKNLRKHAKISY